MHSRTEEYKPVLHATQSSPAIHNMGSPIISFAPTTLTSTHSYPQWQGSVGGTPSTVISGLNTGFSSPQTQLGGTRYTIPTPTSNPIDWKYNGTPTPISSTIVSHQMDAPHSRLDSQDSLSGQTSLVRGLDGRVSYSKVFSGDQLTQVRSPTHSSGHPIQMTSSYMVGHPIPAPIQASNPMTTSYSVPHLSHLGVIHSAPTHIPTTTIAYQAKPFSQGYNF